MRVPSRPLGLCILPNVQVQGGWGKEAIKIKTNYIIIAARDPTFWRWHKYVDDIYRELTEKIMPRCKKNHFVNIKNRT